MKKYKRMPVSRHGFPRKIKIVSPQRGRPKKIKPMKKAEEFEVFCEWASLPSPVREPRTQKEFSKKWGVGEDTLSKWKHKQLFWEKVAERRIEWARGKTSDVILGLFRNASISGNAAEVKLWMQLVEDWSEKQQLGPPNITVIGIQGITPDDLRTLVSPVKEKKAEGPVEEAELVAETI